MSKVTPGLPEDCSNEAGHSGPMIDDLFDSAGMDGVNRDLDARTGWTVFPAQELFENGKDGQSEVVISQGPWFDRRALEHGGIVDRYACDGCLLSDVRVEWTDTWCWYM